MDKLVMAFKKNPVVYLTIVVAVLLTLHGVLVEKKPLAEVFTEEYVTGVLLAASAIVARIMVYAKPNAEAKVERALADASQERTKAAQPEAVEGNGDIARWEDEGGAAR